MTQRRFGNFQLFARGVAKDEGRYDGLQQGIVTYDEAGNYQVSYIELGLRCDHIGEKIDAVRCSRTSITDPMDCDADLMLTKSVTPASTPAVDTVKTAENSVVPTTVTV